MLALRQWLVRQDWLVLIHRWSSWIALPFLLISILLGLALSHAQWLERWSTSLYPSLPIPAVQLDEPVQPGSWEQALRLAKLVTGKDGHVITTSAMDDSIVVVQAFELHSHDPAVAKANPHLRVHIDARDMRVVRIDDKHHSLLSQAHGVHAIRFFDRDGWTIANVSAFAMLVLLLTGGWLGWRQSQKKGRDQTAQPDRWLRWHAISGKILALFILVIALTTLDMEFGLLPKDRKATHPVPEVSLNEVLRPGSLDQARRVAAQATSGTLPRTVFIRGSGEMKFSEVGDGIGGQSVWLDAQTMQIKRLTDWRNDRSALVFILHDGRWLGGLNAFNLYDAASLGLLFLMLTGLVRHVRRFRGLDA